MNAQPQFTVADVVQRYVANRDQMAEISKRHAEELEPYAKRKEIMEQWLLAQLNARNEDSVKCEHGTVYTKTEMSVTVDKDGGWDRVMDYILSPALERMTAVLENGGNDAEAIAAFRNGPELALINQSVNKTAVKEILEATQTPPPGVKVAHITSVGIRRA